MRLDEIGMDNRQGRKKESLWLEEPTLLILLFGSINGGL